MGRGEAGEGSEEESREQHFGNQLIRAGFFCHRGRGDKQRE